MIKWIILGSLLIAAIVYIVKMKEYYPSIGDIKNFSDKSHFNENSLTVGIAVDRYEALSTFPYFYDSETSTQHLDIISVGKFNKNYCMFLYLINALMYRKLYYWRDICEKNYKIWMIGPAEFLSNNDINSLIQNKKAELLSILSNCIRTNLGATTASCINNINISNYPSIQTNPQNVETTALNLISEIERLQIRNDKYDTLYFLYKKRNLGTPLEKELMYIDDLENKLINSTITPRTSLDVYNLNYTCIEGEECKPYMNTPAINLVDSKFYSYNLPEPAIYASSLLESDNILERAAAKNYLKYISTEDLDFSDLNKLSKTLSKSYIWVKNLGMCTDPTAIDFGLSLVREAGSIYKVSEKGNIYLISLRGIIFPDEAGIALDIEPFYLDENLNYEVHGGFYKCYKNKPLTPSDNKYNMPFDIENPPKYKGAIKLGYNRYKIYDTYVKNGSLQDQIREFVRSTKIDMLIISGHSMGAGIAQCVISDLLYNKLIDKNKIVSYLLNSPRSINVDLMRFITKELDGKIYDVQNIDDMLTSLPIPHLEPKLKNMTDISIIDGEITEYKIVSLDKGFTYCHFNNIIGYVYQRDSVIKNHFLEGADYGMDRLYDIIYTPTTDKVIDIILNGIYQKIKDARKITSNFENARGCFLGTNNPSYWIRGWNNDDTKTPTLFYDIYPERLKLMNNKQAFLTMRAIQFLVLDFIENRAVSEFKNIPSILNVYNRVKLLVENDILSNINIYADRNNEMWRLLYTLFNEILNFFKESKRITNDELNELKIQNIDELKDIIYYSYLVPNPPGTYPTYKKYETIKAVTRTFFLCLCPPNLKATKRSYLFVNKAIYCLLHNLGYYKFYGLVEGSNVLREEFIPSIMYILINSYLSRLGIYFDKLGTIDIIDKNAEVRSRIGYGNFDWRIWEMLFGRIGAVNKDFNENKTMVDNIFIFNRYKPLMNLENFMPKNTFMNTKFGEMKFGGTYNVVSYSCEENDTCSNIQQNTKLMCENRFNLYPNVYSQDPQNYYEMRENLPIPGYDDNSLKTDITSTVVGTGNELQQMCIKYGKEITGKDIVTFSDLMECKKTLQDIGFNDTKIFREVIGSQCNGGDLLTRFGRNLTDCMNTYDPVLSQSLLKMFDNNTKIDRTIKSTIFSNGPKPVKCEISIIPVPSFQKKRIILVKFDSVLLDKDYLSGRILFDKIIADIVYAIKTQRFGNLSEQVIKMYNLIKDIYTWTAPIVGIGSVIAMIFTESLATAISGGVALAAAAIIGLILLVAEQSGNNDVQRARRILQILPYTLIEIIKDKYGDKIISQRINSQLDSKIGVGYSASLVKEIIEKHIDVLLGPEFNILSESLPDFVSFKDYTQQLSRELNLDGTISSRYYLGKNEDKYGEWNIYNVPAVAYHEIRPKLFEQLNKIIKSFNQYNQDFHIFVSGFGIGGAVAQCMLLDGCISECKYTDGLDKTIKNLSLEKITYYNFATPRVFNSIILDYMSDRSKSVCYNFINLDDYFTSYPSSLFNTFGGNKKTIKIDSEQDFNNLNKKGRTIYIDNIVDNKYSVENTKRYHFAHYPLTMVINTPIGLKYKRNSDFYNLGSSRSERYNYVEKAHSPQIYMNGLIDLNNKILGGWFDNYNSQVFIKIDPIIYKLIPQSNITLNKKYIKVESNKNNDKYNIPSKPKPITVTIPNVIGMDRIAAESLLTSQGFNVNTNKVYIEGNNNYNKIIIQDPPGGTQNTPFIIVNITFQIEPITTPNFIGMNIQDASNLINRLGLRLNKNIQYVNNYTRLYEVISQNPNVSTLLPPDSIINLTYNGPLVPNLIGLRLYEAERLLNMIGFVYQKNPVFYNYSIDTVNNMTKISSQFPDMGARLNIDNNESITINYTASTMPNLIGLSLNNVQNTLLSIYLFPRITYEYETYNSDNPNPSFGKVILQNDSEGSTIDIYNYTNLTMLAPKVPNVIGMDFNQAKELLIFLEFIVRTEGMSSSSDLNNKVIIQSLLPEQNIRPGSLIIIYYGVG